MLTPKASYEELYREFRWPNPEFYNIGVNVCDKWAAAAPDRDALIFYDAAGEKTRLTFGALCALSNRLAHALNAAGVKKGDRVGILLPQAPETAYAHIAVYKLAAIALPLFTLFGPEALEYRLSDAAAGTLITNAEGFAKLESFRDRLPGLRTFFLIEPDAPEAQNLRAAMEERPTYFEPVKTRANDPALIIYTSGTTGKPKGALHAHRVLLGHLPGVEMSHDFLPQPGDLIWTPADWAWIGGLIDVLLPALHHGVPVVAHRLAKFSGEAAFAVIKDFGVRNAFLPPTAIKFMRAASMKDPALKLTMRSVASGGEPLGAELLQWGREALGVTINEFYGQTECNMVVSSCAALAPARPGFMGRAVPGHDVQIVDAEGNISPPGVAGSIAVRRGDPVMFLGYWNNSRSDAKQISRRLVDHRRHRGRRRRRLAAVPGARRRHHHFGGLSHRSRRDRGLPDPPPGGADGRGHRQARPGAHRDRQGLCRAQARILAQRGFGAPSSAGLVNVYGARRQGGRLNFHSRQARRSA